MEPKSGKRLPFFNPFAIWTDFALKSGEAMLDAAQSAVERPKTATKVAVLSKSARKARKNASSRVRPRGR